MTPESPDARRIRQAAEWAALTVAAAEELQTLSAMGCSSQEMIEFITMASDCRSYMADRHLNEWMPE